MGNDGRTADLTSFFGALAEARRKVYTRARRVPLTELDEWRVHPATGDLVHETGRFFTVEGIGVTVSSPTESRSWTQPVIVQTEVGILGIITKRFDGVPHYLMQLKAEPGNVNGIQVSPTVQATRSNYTRVHGGRSVPYLDYFRDRERHRTISDVRQSEQGTWFLHKRNRNMVVEPAGEVPVLDGFHWLTMDHIRALLRTDDLVNMDARSVLSCLPAQRLVPRGEDAARGTASDCSWSGAVSSRHGMTHLLSWITEARAGTDVSLRKVSLTELDRWHYDGDGVVHEDPRFFDIIGVRVEAGGREVGGWDQPMIEVRRVGLAAFLATRIDGVLHVAVGIRTEPGFVDVVELAPTVQCTQGDHYSDREERPPFLDTVLGADPGRVLYDTTLSEEGGRFFRTRTRYMVVEIDDAPDHPDHRWMTPHQITELMRHSHYVNIQARTLMACLAALPTERGGDST